MVYKINFINFALESSAESTVYYSKIQTQNDHIYEKIYCVFCYVVVLFTLFMGVH